MSDITLSKAVRSNLLNLQSTAGLLSKSQERLSTGLRVNSALDNPTNFFTAQGLNSRANDLSQLLDSVSNAVQTVAAADKGITAITKLVESAQATARQALQTAATVSTDVAATAGTFNAGAFTTVDVSGTASGATAGSITGGAFTSMDFTVTPATAGTATLDTTDFAASTFGTGDTLTFDIAVDGGAATTVTVTGANVAAVGNNDATIDDISELASAINAAGLPGGVTAAIDGNGDLTFTSGTTGASSAVAISNVVANDTSTDGTITTSGLENAASTAGQAAGAAKSLTFDVAVDGGSATSVTINLASVQAVGNNDGIIDSVTELASIVDAQLGAGVTVDGSGATLVLSSATSGGSSDITISNTTANNITNTSGVADGTDAGSASVAADSISFSLTVDGGSASTITLDAAAVTAYNGANSASLSASSLTAANVASIINYQAGATVATVGTGGALTFTSTSTGASSSIAISGFTSAGTPGGSTGIANNTDTGSAASTGTGVNPKRAELVTTYNDLLGQIDALAKDSGFNGVNLLNGDNLSVLFNEDGSSSLAIGGVTNTAAGLGLTTLASTAFDTNTSINSTLDDLKSSIDTLRGQSAKFGSNLSVVETRQDFTKNMINVLQTGASNLTLADTNEEAANVLALQTRQQLSSTALSLASQADQNVLRLF
jgi:flagellin